MLRRVGSDQMERRSSTLEDLAPLELRPLRDLELDGEDPARVCAASGVVRRGDFVYVIGDDLLSIGEFRLSDPRTGTLRRVFAHQRSGEDAGSGSKPDLEALTVLPPFAGSPYGALLGLGSGSGPGLSLIHI